jgi:hypothetical protein
MVYMLSFTLSIDILIDGRSKLISFDLKIGVVFFTMCFLLIGSLVIVYIELIVSGLAFTLASRY